MLQVDLTKLCQAVKDRLGSRVNLSTTAKLPRDWFQAEWGSVKWVQVVAILREHYQLITQVSGDLLAPARDHFCNIFDQDVSLKLSRFSGLLRCITHDILPAFTASVEANIKPELQRMVESLVSLLYWGEWTTMLHRAHEDRFFVGCVLSHFVIAMQHECQQPHILKLPEGFQLEEDLKVQQQRAALTLEINRLDTAHLQISHIEDAFSTTDSPTSSLAAAVRGAFTAMF